jgi:hypothetical protein
MLRVSSKKVHLKSQKIDVQKAGWPSICAALLLVAGAAHTFSITAVQAGDSSPVGKSQAASPESLMELFKTLQTDTAGRQVMMGVLNAMSEDLSPSQAQKLEKFYREKINFKELTERLIPIYQKHFTQSDVQAAIDFYRSPVGQKFLEKQPQVVMEAQPIISAWADENRMRLASMIRGDEKKGRRPSSVGARRSTPGGEAGKTAGSHNPFPGVRRF